MWKSSYFIYSKRKWWKDKISGETNYALLEYYLFQTIETLISKVFVSNFYLMNALQIKLTYCRLFKIQFRTYFPYFDLSTIQC